jgi:hypothetical protein
LVGSSLLPALLVQADRTETTSIDETRMFKNRFDALFIFFLLFVTKHLIETVF